MGIVIDYTNGFFEATPSGESVGDVTGNATLDLSTGTFFEHTPTQNTAFVFNNPVPSGKVSRFSLKVTGANVSGDGPDISSAAPDFGVQLVYANDMEGFFLSADGTVGYELNVQNDRFYYWTLTTAFDLSTATRNAYFFNIGSQDGSPEDFHMSPDGTKMFMTGRSTDTVYSYTLSTAFDLTTISYDSVSFSVSSQTTDPRGLWFKPDGTKMYVFGYSSTIHEYSLSTAFDISTASFVASGTVTSFQDGFSMSDDGTKLITCRSNNDSLQYHTLSTAFDITTLSAATSVVLGRGLNVYFQDSGNKLFLSSNNDTTQSYDLSTPYDISTASISAPTGQAYAKKAELASGSYSGAYGLFFKPDGLKLFVADDSMNKVLPFTLTTAFDLSTASFDDVEGACTSAPRDLIFKSDGLSYYVLNSSSSDRVYQYNLTTAWDVTTASYSGNSFDVTTQDAIPIGLDFKPDGTKMYYTGSSTDTIYQYTLSTAWDITTASYDSVSFSIASQASNSGNIKLSSDGTKLILLSHLGGLFSYSLSTAYDLSTASYDSTSYDDTGFTQGFGLAFNGTNTKTYVNSSLDYFLGYETATQSAASFTYPASVLFSGGTTPTAPAVGETDLLEFMTSDGGTTYLGRLLGDDFS